MPNLLDEVFNILREYLRFLHSRKMATFGMRTGPHEIASLLHPARRHASQFLWEEGVPKRFRDLLVLVAVEEGRGSAEELAVRIDGTGKGFCVPVQCHTVEDLIDWGIGIGPDLELLSDPV